MDFILILQLYLAQFEVLATSVAALRPPLVTATPIGPGQDRPGRGRHPQPQVPQQARISGRLSPRPGRATA